MKNIKVLLYINSRKGVFFVICAIAIYIISFLFLSVFYGSGEAISAIIPVVVIAWLYGYKAGIIAALITFPINILLCEIIGADWGAKMIGSGGGVAGTFALLLIGGVVGRISDLNILLKKKNEHIEKEIIERKKVEEELQKEKDQFDDILKKLFGVHCYQ